MPLRTIFFGTPMFAVPSLEAILGSAHPVVGVVTQPDRPRGRGQRVRGEAVKEAALAHGIPILQPERLKPEMVRHELAALGADIGVVAAYGKILPGSILDLPPLGLINVHASLLPRWRGAAPVHRAILAGDTITGVTIMRVVQALDAGPMLDRVETPISDEETSAELEMRLAHLGARSLRTVLDRLDAARQGSGPQVDEVPQDDSAVTYASRLERRESAIDWARPAQDIHNQIRGLHPWPLAAAMLHGRRTILRRAHVVDHDARAGAPGSIVDVDRERLHVAALPGIIALTTLQLEGRAPVPVRDFLNGARLRVGDVFLPLPEMPG
jgi:methionyl-tRNA formyltransferase